MRKSRISVKMIGRTNIDPSQVNHHITMIKYVIYTPIRFKRDNLFQYFSLMKSSDDIIYFCTCILPDYVAHESLKEF